MLHHFSKSKNQYEFLLEMEDLKIIKLNKNRIVNHKKRIKFDLMFKIYQNEFT